MKKVFLIKIFAFIFILFISFDVKASVVYLNDVYEMRENSELLAEVTSVNIYNTDNLDYVEYLSLLPNLNYIYAARVSFNDVTFLNNINHTFSFSMDGGTGQSVDLNGINNPNLEGLSLGIITIKNFSSIQNLTNLKKLKLEVVFNHEELDYSILTNLSNLQTLSIRYMAINNYQQFFSSINQLNNLQELYLESSNIQNKDIKYLKANTHIKRLYLNETMIEDISFLEDMPNIETIGLPSQIKNFSVLYEMDNLKSVWWDNYTQYNVTSDLVTYLDSKGIYHTTHYDAIRNTINDLVEEANILDTDDDYTKVLKVMKVMQEFAIIDTGGYNPNEDTGGTSLSKIVLLQKGVCANWSALTNVLLNIVGVESYTVTGFMGMVHAWNIVKIDGKKYAIDIMNARPEPTNYFDVSSWDSQVKAVMFRDPFRVDSYREIDAKNNNLDYNYEFPDIYTETDGYDTTRMLYEFDVANGILNISKKNIWVDLNTNLSSLNLVTVDGYSYNYYDSQGNIKTTGIVETGDYIIVTSTNDLSFSHRYDIIVEEKTYQITLESDSFGRNESITVTNGGKYTGLFTPVKFCYRFLGWYTAKNGGTKITEDSIVNINQVNTLYAHWEFDNKLIVTAIVQGYAPDPYIVGLDDTYYHAKSIYNDASIPQLNYANYAAGPDEKFSGFYSEKNGGYLLTFYSTVIVNDNHNIYAHFIDKNSTLYTVTVDCGACRIYPNTWLIEPNKKIAQFYTPTRDGYTFKNWTVNGEVFNFNTPITGDITISAEWEEDVHSQVTVTFDSNGGSSVSSQTINYNSKATQPADPTKMGYTFKEWQLNGQTYNFNNSVTSNITLTAVWTANKYFVSFDSDGGSSVSNQIIDYNGKVIKPADPTKTGYTFKEWRFEGHAYDFDTPVTDHITLLAEWTINKYTVTFDSNGGSSVASQTINYEFTVTQPANPTKNGYTFKEWQLNGVAYNFDTPVTGNITLTATWTKNEVIDDDTLKDILEDNGYNVTSSYVSKFKIGDTIASIKSKLGSDVTVETSQTIISTGAVIKKGNESYTVVIKGDLTGEGKVNSGDLLQMRKYLLEEINLTGAYKEAGIIESVGNIKSLDLLRLRQYLLGEYEFK